MISTSHGKIFIDLSNARIGTHTSEDLSYVETSLLVNAKMLYEVCVDDHVINECYNNRFVRKLDMKTLTVKYMNDTPENQAKKEQIQKLLKVQ